MDRKPLSLRCDPEQYSTLLWPPAMRNHSCIRQELACYTLSDGKLLFTHVGLDPSCSKEGLEAILPNVESLFRQGPWENGITLLPYPLLRRNAGEFRNGKAYI